MIEAIIFDYGRTLYDPVTEDLFPKTTDVLNDLREKGIRLSLVTIAIDIKARQEELVKFKIGHLFSLIKILNLDQPKRFSEILNGFRVNPSNVAVVGDNLRREITEGNRLGAYTIWTKQNLLGPFTPRNDLETPKSIINDIKELTPLIESLTSL